MGYVWCDYSKRNHKHASHHEIDTSGRVADYRCMSSAIHNLQVAIVEGKQSLTQLLRQAKLISSKLNLDDVGQWVDLELNGYPAGTETPSYRDFVTNSLQYNNPYQSGWQFAGNLNINLKARQSISEIENFAKGNGVAMPNPKPLPLTDITGDSTLASNFPQRLTVAPDQFRRIVDAVTNKLLEWATELEKRGIKGENMNFDDQEKRAAGNLTFNIGTVHGAVGNLTNSPTTINNVTVHDYSSIQQLLVERNIPKPDRRELEDIMDELKEASPKKKPTLIARAEKWVVKHQEILGVAVETVRKALGL